MSEPVLSVQGLVTSFPVGRGRAAAVDDVSFEVAQGEVLALVGESGCGKSVTALSLLRLVPKPGRIEAGSIRIGGRDVLALPVSELRRVRGREAAMIFQEPMTSLSPVLTVGAQVVEALQLHEPLSRAQARRRTVELFEQVRIPDPDARFDAYPHELSGRPQAARDDRDGAGAAAEAADRRRADDRARRHDPGADPRADARPPARARHRDPADHARSRRGERARGSHRRDVRRASRRRRPPRADPRRRAPSLHARAAARRALARPPRRAARRDRRASVPTPQERPAAAASRRVARRAAALSPRIARRQRGGAAGTSRAATSVAQEQRP